VFTGIVEGIGTVADVTATGTPGGDGGAQGRRLRLRVPPAIREGLAAGDSVAVEGACLTATALHPDGFSVDVIGTTLSRTTAGNWEAGTRVNLERALALGGRLSGHLVQGHVDGVGAVLAVRDEGTQRLVDLSLPAAVDAVTILHGSITVNGVSLTVNALPAPLRCQVALIPHTLAATTLGDLRVGDPINLEGDLIGKYVGRMLAPHRLQDGAPPLQDEAP
jgi:riboflavin synthase